MPKSKKRSKNAPKYQYIWNTYGDWVATKVGDYIWDLTGTWVAWVEDNEVYKVDGEWVGTLSRDSRILRKRVSRRPPLRTDIPPAPEKPDLPARAPLPPAFAELTYSEIDVLEEDPDVFKRISDRRPDMD
ncbi:MAG TPA: hypothetical protein ENI95_00725 [Chloroflexi bacterium]|nr:hypothetical protein [Chloroflexota bacterium]